MNSTAWDRDVRPPRTRADDQQQELQQISSGTADTSQLKRHPARSVWSTQLKRTHLRYDPCGGLMRVPKHPCGDVRGPNLNAPRCTVRATAWQSKAKQNDSIVSTSTFSMPNRIQLASLEWKRAGAPQPRCTRCVLADI